MVILARPAALMKLLATRARIHGKITLAREHRELLTNLAHHLSYCRYGAHVTQRDRRGTSWTLTIGSPPEPFADSTSRERAES